MCSSDLSTFAASALTRQWHNRSIWLAGHLIMALGVALTVAMLQRTGHSRMTNFRAAWTLQGIVALCVAVVMIVGFRPPADNS